MIAVIFFISYLFSLPRREPQYHALFDAPFFASTNSVPAMPRAAPTTAAFLFSSMLRYNWTSSISSGVKPSASFPQTRYSTETSRTLAILTAASAFGLLFLVVPFDTAVSPMPVRTHSSFCVIPHHASSTSVLSQNLDFISIPFGIILTNFAKKVAFVKNLVVFSQKHAIIYYILQLQIVTRSRWHGARAFYWLPVVPATAGW